MEHKAVSLFIRMPMVDDPDVVKLLTRSLYRHLETEMPPTSVRESITDAGDTVLEVIVSTPDVALTVRNSVRDWLEGISDRRLALVVAGEFGESTLSDLSSPLLEQFLRTSIDIAVGAW